MNEDERKALIEQARAMQAQADALLAAAGEEDSAASEADSTEEGAGDTTDEPPRSGEQVEEAAEPVAGDEDDEEARVDPPEVMDMRDELVKVRDLLGSRNFVRKTSQAEGEVWERAGPRGEPGFRATLVSTPHGRIRLEIRDPGGFMVTQAEPATLIDSEIALRLIP